MHGGAHLHGREHIGQADEVADTGMTCSNMNIQPAQEASYHKEVLIEGQEDINSVNKYITLVWRTGISIYMQSSDRCAFMLLLAISYQPKVHLSMLDCISLCFLLS